MTAHIQDVFDASQCVARSVDATVIPGDRHCKTREPWEIKLLSPDLGALGPQRRRARSHGVLFSICGGKGGRCGVYVVAIGGAARGMV